jgi:hypothetical protein
MEQVHAVWDYYDGPRSGVADYRNLPHYFECGWDAGNSNFGDVFALTTLDEETFSVACEQWEIWRKWELAFHDGRVPLESHPGHGGIDARYDELETILNSRISLIGGPRTFARASFSTALPVEDVPPGMMRTLVVDWSDARAEEFLAAPDDPLEGLSDA